MTTDKMPDEIWSICFEDCQVYKRLVCTNLDHSGEQGCNKYHHDRVLQAEREKVKELADVLEIVWAISNGDRSRIEQAGFDFKTVGNCSDWITKKIEEALEAHRKNWPRDRCISDGEDGE